MSKENKTTVDILLELVLGYRKHTDKLYEWFENLKSSNQELREALGNPVCIVKKPKPKTNFEKISSSVESLAKFIDNYYWCPYNNKYDCNKYPDCVGCIKEWLQREAENEN